MLCICLLLFCVSQGWLGELPKIEELENPKSSLATEVISSDGVVMGKYYIENRSNETFQSLGPNLVNALIATEDIRFYNHSGIDFRGVFTGFFYNLVEKKRGASTITQQLAKNLFPRKKFNNFFNRAITKLKEWVVAVRLEERYTKEEIITMYFNTVQFAGNAFGVKSAAKIFFNKKPNELAVEEAALLVGILKGIGMYDPIRHYDRALTRRNTVLSQMNKYDFLEDVAFEKLRKKPIDIHYTSDDHSEGLATYFREYLRQEIRDWAEENGFDIYKDGLKIYTTIDSKMQAAAEESLKDHLKNLQGEFNRHWKGREPAKEEMPKLLEQAMKKTDRYRLMRGAGASDEDIKTAFAQPHKMKVFSCRGVLDTSMTPLDSIKYYKKMLMSGFMAMDPHNGQIKAWVGGQDYKYFKYDHVNPHSTRQVGSSFKPFVYTLAVDNGFSPCTTIPNQPVTFEDFDNWTPNNSEGIKGKEFTMYKGLALSVNYGVAWLLKQLGPQGPQKVIDQARLMGIKGKLEPYPSICLGVFDLSVFEMTGAFATFANKGIWTEPHYLLRITDKNGHELERFTPKTQEAMSEQTAYVMLKLLEGCVNHGTAYDARGKYKIKGAAAGKTGTTQNNSDGWFMGITPNLVCGTWTGCEDRAVHFRSTDLGAGGHMAMPIWATFLNKLQDEKNGFKTAFPESFEAPKTKLTIEMDCTKFQRESNDDDNPPDFEGQ